MMLGKEALEKMDVEELRLLYQSVKAVLEKKERENKKEFKFHFEATSHVPKWKPYVARLKVRGGMIEREFKDLERVNGKKETTVFGSYTAKVGDIIEKREGGSWKNEYRYWYLILEDGKEVKVASIGSSKEKQKVIEYLKGNLVKEELIRDAWVKDVE